MDPSHPHTTDPPASPRRFNVTLAGETNLDLILYGLPARLPPGRELLAEGLAVTLGGSSSILAHNLARMGSRVGFTTELGGDAMAAAAEQFLIDAGVDLTTLRRKPTATTGLTVLLSHPGERHILTYPGVMTELAVANLRVSTDAPGLIFTAERL